MTFSISGRVSPRDPHICGKHSRGLIWGSRDDRRADVEKGHVWISV